MLTHCVVGSTSGTPSTADGERMLGIEFSVQGESGVCTWLFCIACQACVLTNAGKGNKAMLSSEIGVPLRDLRSVDPSYPFPATFSVLVRQKAVLFSLEVCCWLVGWFRE